ncbi:hypothetical protein [Pseudoalteromonas luteoviolacea]|uniref:hypothetical protein n=1 Tax=Pseudoalteromonas luteoviolacea TaxID=43657 RepID=UPI000A7AF6AE|nr:hypothetical protein [Pseudoalteromonas luteoviolacea]
MGEQTASKVHWQIIADGEVTIPHLHFSDVIKVDESKSVSLLLTLSALNTEYKFNDLRAT